MPYNSCGRAISMLSIHYNMILYSKDITNVLNIYDKVLNNLVNNSAVYHNRALGGKLLRRSFTPSGINGRLAVR